MIKKVIKSGSHRARIDVTMLTNTAIFVPHFFSFVFVIMASTFLLETKESESIKLHGNRKGSDRHISRVNFHFILGVKTDC